MRQAGRILPQYRALRAKLSGFKELVETPNLACEVTIQPIDELGVDAAIIFSDILVVPEAMGLPYEMIEKKGPFFPTTIKTEADIDKLQVINGSSNLDFTIKAIEQTVKELNGRVPLIGFAGAPFTILCYMIEGQGSKTFSNARKLLYANEALAHKLLQKITDTTIFYLKNQVGAGVSVVQLFDSWAGVLNQQLYKQFCLPYIAQICDALADTPFTFFAKGAYFSMHDFAALNCETIGLDWTMNPTETRKILGEGKVLQGNFDPAQLYGSHTEIKQATQNMIKQFGKHKHIVNLGHGVYPDTPLNGVKTFVNAVKNFKH
ncbi:UNVERIFIED_CONTAM: hypothetical protein GTU68_014413 [Idotea baltica]|nr:hypothetical protein [Idotea baltica]